MKIKILTEGISGRLLYAADFIFNNVLNIDYSLDISQDKDTRYHIVYGCSRGVKSALYIPCDSLMFETELRVVRPAGQGEGEAFRMFGHDNRGWGYDLFAMTFYFLSRYEEYYEKEYDTYGRISVKNLDPVRHQFVDIPLLDILIRSLANELKKRFPALEFRKSGYEVLPGIDIDFMYLFRHRNVGQKLISFSRSVLKNELGKGKDFLKSIFREMQDPYAGFSDWLPSLKENPCIKNVFILSSLRKSDVDLNLHPRHPLFRLWLEQIKGIPDLYIGWHPSVRAGADRYKLAEEKAVLEEIVGSKIEKSRQHFVSMKLPDTYRSLLALGIREEHSMGFNNISGFRASTAYPFYWYDVQEEKKTDLKVYPFIFMDVQLKGYMELNRQQAIENIRRYKAQLIQTGGVLSFIWHNSSFYKHGGWEGWAEVYEFLLRKV